MFNHVFMANLDYKSVAFWTFVIGGLGLFLYGIASLSKTLKRMAGSKLKTFLSKCSNNPLKGVLFGCGFTTVIQSSSGTTALTVGLVRAGILNFIEAVGIIIGANIGTTITAFIISIPILEYMPIVLFIGGLIVLIATKNKITNIGELCFSLGAVFFGLWIINLNLKQLTEVSWFSEVFIQLNNQPWLGLLVGILSATIFQSSSAVIGVLQGIYAATNPFTITLFGIVPIVLGANIGTTIDVILASIGGSKEAKRVALFHVMFNVTGALIFMGLLYACKGFLTSSSDWATQNPDGSFSYIVDPKLQIALVHLTFNLTTSIIFLPLLKPIDKLCKLIIPGKEIQYEAIVIKELDTKAMKEFPATGISIAKQEVNSMFSYAIKMYEYIGEYLEKPKDDLAQYIHELEDSINKIDRQLNEYLICANKEGLSDADLYLYSVVLKGCKDIERLGDYGENIISFLETCFEKKISFEKNPLIDKIIDRNKIAIKVMTETNEIYVNSDKVKALDIIKEKRELLKADEADLDKFFDTFIDRTQAINFLDLNYTDIISDYERVYAHCSNICKLFNNDKKYN